MEDETLTTAPMPFKSMLSFWKRLFRQSFHPLQASGHILCVALLPLVLVACSSPKPRELQPVVSNGWGEAKQVVIKKDLAELDLPLAIRELPRVEIEKTRRYLFMFERITMHFISTNTSNGSILSVRASFPKTSESNPYASLQMGVGKNAVLYTLSLGSPYCLHLAETLCVPKSSNEAGLPERVDYLRELLRGRYSYKEAAPWFK